MRRTSRVSVVLAMFAVACEDKAKPAYAECVTAEAKGDFLAAEKACSKSVTSDPTSTSGKAAAEKLKAMQPAIETAKKQQAEADAKAAEERRAADAARQQAEAAARARAAADARRKVRTKYWGFEPSDTCTAKGLPPFQKDYGGGTLEEDEMVAVADGCQHLYPGRASDPLLFIQFCCPR